MRTLVLGALAATLAGCSCFLSPQAAIDACASADGTGIGCHDKSGAASRLSQATIPDSAEANSTSARARSPQAARTPKASSKHKDGATRHARDDEAKSTTVAKTESAPAAEPADAIDPVVDKAKIAVTVKLENPASAAFTDMNRAMRKNMLGQSVDTICGRVKSKKASGEDADDRVFLYLVKNDEAYVVDGSPTSAASSAYRNICN
jgi:hypothetical protein